MSLRDEFKDIGADTVRQAIPEVGTALGMGLIALIVARIKVMPEKIAMRTARRQKRRAARKAGK